MIQRQTIVTEGRHHEDHMSNWNKIIMPLILLGLIAFWYGVGKVTWHFITRLQ